MYCHALPSAMCCTSTSSRKCEDKGIPLFPSNLRGNRIVQQPWEQGENIEKTGGYLKKQKERVKKVQKKKKCKEEVVLDEGFQDYPEVGQG